MATRTVEDYVKTLYLEQQRVGGALVQPGKLAAAMGVVPGTVTTMVRALSDAGLVSYEPRLGVRLTAAGDRLALHVLRRHRLVEQFLVKVVGLDWSEVHDEAEELEHVISDRVLERIDELLGRPKFDPHGDPIPDAAGRVDDRPTMTLNECEEGSRLIVSRVNNQDAEFLRFAQDAGLVPGKRIRMGRHDRAAGTLTVLRPGGRQAVLSTRAADAVLVTPA